MKKLLYFIIIIICFNLSGCIKRQEQPKEDKREYVTYGVERLPKDLIMLEENDLRSGDILCALFDGLVEFNDKGEISPSLAESWEVSKDKLEYTFKLREDASWSDGKSIEAKHFVDFFKVILSPKTQNNFAYELFPIYGVEEYKKGYKSFSDVAISAIDKKTLQIRLNYPYEDILKILSKPRYRLRADFAKLKDWKKSYNDINYTGAFKISATQEKEGKEEVLLNKNEKYFDETSVHSDKIVISQCKNSEIAMANFDTKRLDLFLNPPISEFKRLSDQEAINFIPLDNMTALLFNFNSKLGGSESFRKAMKEVVIASMDEDTLLKEMNLSFSKGSMFRDNTKETATIFSLEEDFNQKLRYDLFKANNLVKGLTEEESILNLIAINDEKNKVLIDTMSKILKEELSIKLKVKLCNEEDFEEVLKGNNYDVVLKKYDAATNKSVFLKQWYDKDCKEIMKYRSNSYENLLIKIYNEKDNAKKVEYIKAIENILKTDLSIMPIYFDNLFICIDKSINGMVIDGNQNIILKGLYK